MNDLTTTDQNRDLSAMTEAAMTRQASEIQAAIVIAKKFPRDEQKAFDRIMKSCERMSLAEQAAYEYGKGGTKVYGASIRLAEAMAQNWGNMDFGILELDSKNGESTVMSYAWDLETNTRQTKVFQVKHERHTRDGKYKLTDPREIYEATANSGARRLRACILGIIPGDIQDAAMAKCEATLKGGSQEPLSDRIKKMLVFLQEKCGASKVEVETLLQCKSEAFTEGHLVRLRKILNSIADGMAKKEDFFKGSAKPVSRPAEKTAVEKSFESRNGAITTDDVPFSDEEN